jgi:hypothetical protein
MFNGDEPVKITIAALMALSVLGACKSTMPVASVKDAIVSSDTARDALKIVEATKGYLPYEYSADGCFARATYMQMELAAAGIPSRVVYVRTQYNPELNTWQDGSPRLGPDNWKYHVAPVIKVVDRANGGTNSMEVVLDPGLAPKKQGGAMIIEDWLAAMTSKKFVEVPAGTISRDFSPPGDAFVVSRAANTSDGPVDHQNVRGQEITAVGQMPAFTVSQVINGFRRMEEYLIESAKNGQIDGNEKNKRRKLMRQRTLDLVATLRTQNRIVSESGNDGFDLLGESNLRGIQDAHDQ